MVLSHVMRGRPQGILQSSGGRVDRILSASVLSFIHAMCPKMVRQRKQLAAVKHRLREREREREREISLLTEA